MPRIKLRKRGSYSSKGGEIEVTGVLANRMTERGTRRLMLNAHERRALLQQERIEKAIALYLDLESPHTQAEIAQALDLSLPALKDLTKTKEFMDLYNAHFLELGHDPRLKMTQAAIADLLPTAVKALRDMLVDVNLSPSVRFNIIREIFNRGGIQAPENKGNDKVELAEFLKKANVKGITLEAQFGEAEDADESNDSQIIEAHIVDIPSDNLNLDDIPA